MKALFMRNERGQAMVELALVLPILLILLMGTVEFGRIFHSYLIITNASREGARLATLGASDAEITTRVGMTTIGLDTTKMQINVTPVHAQRKTGIMTTVEVRYNISLVFPLFDIFIPDPIPITSKTVMRIE